MTLRRLVPNGISNRNESPYKPPHSLSWPFQGVARFASKKQSNWARRLSRQSIPHSPFKSSQTFGRDLQRRGSCCLPLAPFPAGSLRAARRPGTFGAPSTRRAARCPPRARRPPLDSIRGSRVAGSRQLPPTEASPRVCICRSREPSLAVKTHSAKWRRLSLKGLGRAENESRAPQPLLLRWALMRHFARKQGTRLLLFEGRSSPASHMKLCKHPNSCAFYNCGRVSSEETAPSGCRRLNHALRHPPISFFFVSFLVSLQPPPMKGLESFARPRKTKRSWSVGSSSANAWGFGGKMATSAQNGREGWWPFE